MSRENSFVVRMTHKQWNSLSYEERGEQMRDKCVHLVDENKDTPMFSNLVLDGELDMTTTGQMFDLVTPRFASCKFDILIIVQNLT